MIEFIRNTPGLRTSHISRAISTPVRTLQRQLRILRNQNRIEFRGSPKTGGYHEKDLEVGGVNGGVKEGVNHIVKDESHGRREGKDH